LKRAFALLLPFVLSACGAHAGPFIIAPAPLPEAPAPALGAEAALSATAQALSGTAAGLSVTAAATLAPTATPAPQFYLVPSKDRRRQRQIWKGKSSY
jgi:hypothetical protein